MIAALSGRVLSKGVDRAVIDVSGVGYEVCLTTETISRLPEQGEEIFLRFILMYVRMLSFFMVLLDLEEKEMYLILTSVSGVGPKLSLAILSGMRVGDLCRAITSKDIKSLTGLQGVGKKTAERICVDLKDKVAHLSGAVGSFTSDDGQGVAPGTSSTIVDALSALANLGYSDPIGRQALSSVKKRLGDETFYGLSVQELLRECLRALA